MIKKLIPGMIRPHARKLFLDIMEKSLIGAAKEQGLSDLVVRLGEIVPDISDQYSYNTSFDDFYQKKARMMHAFQISLVNGVMDDFDQAAIVDIGDSAGTHLRYIKGLLPAGKKTRFLSVNLDEKAVEKIRSKGMDAVVARAEEVEKYGMDADIFLCFEVLEHLTDPCRFLHGLSSKTKAKYLVLTVPYLRDSRVGLYHIRRGRQDQARAETTHIFELKPEDWKLLARHSGWEVVQEKILFQYPKRGLMKLTRPAWRWFDFEGFYGLVLRRDNKWSSVYMDW